MAEKKPKNFFYGNTFTISLVTYRKETTMKPTTKVKILSTLLLALVSMDPLFSQEKSDTEEAAIKDNGYRPPKTLFDNKTIRFSGYGGPMIRFGKLNNQLAVFTGGKGGVMINDSLVIGGGGSGMVHPLTDPTNNYSDTIGYGGFLLEYIFFPKSLINFSLGTIIGAGNGGSSPDFGYNSSLFFVIEPELNLFLNITPFFKIGLTATYRYTNGLDGAYINDKSFTGFTGGLILEFGKF